MMDWERTKTKTILLPWRAHPKQKATLALPWSLLEM